MRKDLMKRDAEEGTQNQHFLEENFSSHVDLVRDSQDAKFQKNHSV